MNKRIISLIIAILLITSNIPLGSFAALTDYPIPDYGRQEQGAAQEKFESGEVLSVAHRAAWRHGPENSLVSIAAAIEIGVDVVELDVALTKDKVLVLFHDATINRTVWRETGKVSDYTWDELAGMVLESGQGGSDKAYRLTESDAAMLNALSNYAEHSGVAEAGGTMPPTRMDDAIELIDKRVMINLDKCTTEELFVACYVLFRETDMLDYVFFKNSVSAATLLSWCESAANAWNEKHPDEPLTKEEVQKSFIYVYVKSSSGTAVLQSHLNAGNPLKMVEMVISNATLDKTYKTVDEVWCRENGVAMFVSTMWAGLADKRPDSEVAWAEMIDRGYTAIQTDRPSELVKYLKETYCTDRDSVDTIEAEHFSDFSYDEGYFMSTPIAGDKNLNKSVSEIRHGEWLEYENIIFKGDEALINLDINAEHPLSYAQVYIDDVLFAEGRLTEDTVLSLEGSVDAGGHTVRIEFIGAPATALATFDSFTFISANALDGCTAEPLYIITAPGEAPVLPSTLTYTVGETKYDLSVKWENIPTANYAKEGHFPVLGYVYALKDYVRAVVAVKTESTFAYKGDIPVNYSAPDSVSGDGLLLWLDATEGITVTDGKVTGWTNMADDTQTATVKGSAPEYLEDAINGKAGVSFDGSTALQITLDTDAFNELDGMTVIAYTKSRTPYLTNQETANGAAWRAQRRTLIYAGEKGGSWGSVYMGVYTDYLSARVGTGTNNDNGYYKAYDGNGGGFSSTAMVWNGTNKIYTMSVDGEAVNTDSSLGSVSTHNSNVLYIGEGKDAGSYGGWDGTLTELIIYDRALSNTELQSVIAYLEGKYLPEVPPVYVEGVNLEGENTEKWLSVGDGYDLTASTVPADADNKSLKWQSSDPAVASVDENGKVKANGAGLAIITVTTLEGGYSASCAVRVGKIYLDSLCEDIENMVSWSQSEDGSAYNGWSAMKSAVAAASGLSCESAVAELEKVYNGLREAMLGLTHKEHNHTYGSSFTVTEANYDEKGLKLQACTHCLHYEAKDIPVRVKISFNDVKSGSWFYGAVEYVVSEGMMNGVAAGKFGPNGTLTRAMVVTVLYRAVGSPAVSAAPNFTDVKKGQWYTDAIAWAQANGVVNGVTATTFAPDKAVTREQIAAILWRYSGSPEMSADLGVFTDGNKVSSYAKDAMLWAVSKGIFAGSNGALLPRDNATRAQFATIIMRFFG